MLSINATATPFTYEFILQKSVKVFELIDGFECTLYFDMIEQKLIFVAHHMDCDYKVVLDDEHFKSLNCSSVREKFQKLSKLILTCVDISHDRIMVSCETKTKRFKFGLYKEQKTESTQLVEPELPKILTVEECLTLWRKRGDSLTRLMNGVKDIPNFLNQENWERFFEHHGLKYKPTENEWEFKTQNTLSFWNYVEPPKYGCDKTADWGSTKCVDCKIDVETHGELFIEPVKAELLKELDTDAYVYSNCGMIKIPISAIKIEGDMRLLLNKNTITFCSKIKRLFYIKMTTEEMYTFLIKYSGTYLFY